MSQPVTSPHSIDVSTDGQTMTILPGETPCLRCVIESSPPPGMAPTCETAGVLGPAISIVAGGGGGGGAAASNQGGIGFGGSAGDDGTGQQEMSGTSVISAPGLVGYRSIASGSPTATGGAPGNAKPGYAGVGGAAGGTSNVGSTLGTSGGTGSNADGGAGDHEHRQVEDAAE